VASDSLAGGVESAYTRIGAAPAIKAVVDRFYEYLVADEELARYFRPLDAGAFAALKRHQVAMLSQVLGGPRQYAGRDLAEAHGPLHVTGRDYRRVAHLLVGTLWEFNVPEQIIFEVTEVLAALRETIAPPVEAAAGHRS
jgi:hemoglobin